jgi:hypothetical protein
MDHEQVLTDLAQRLRDVAGHIREPGTNLVGQFQNAVFFELPKAVRDGNLRMLELELVQLAGRIEGYWAAR